MTPAKRSDTGREVGTRIRVARGEKGLSQEALANQLGKRQATISDWERGDPVPGLEDLYDIAWVLGVDIHYFLPPQRQEEPTFGLMRALEEQLPPGSTVGAATAIFVRRASQLPAPTRQVKLPRARRPDRAAAELLVNGEITGPPVDIVWLGHRCGVRVLPWDGMHPSMSGILVALEDAPLIAYNGSHPTGRQRFTIAHELGHLVLGHLDELHVDVSAREGSDERPGYDSAQEKAANEFAANLLMPAPWVKARASAGEPPDHMAGLFQVSDLALGYRFMSLGIKPEDS